MKIHKYVGLDVHSDTTMIAVAEGERSGEVRLYGQISSDLNALEKVLRNLRKQARELGFILTPLPSQEVS